MKLILGALLCALIPSLYAQKSDSAPMKSSPARTPAGSTRSASITGRPSDPKRSTPAASTNRVRLYKLLRFDSNQPGYKNPWPNPPPSILFVQVGTNVVPVMADAIITNLPPDTVVPAATPAPATPEPAPAAPAP
jgi:hypothetical protein